MIATPLATSSRAFLPTPLNSSLGMSTNKPKWAAQPWPYLFSIGDQAWARGGNNQWRMVTIEDDGVTELHDGVIVTVYTARWIREKNKTVRGSFAPLDGDLKPADQETRNLLREDGAKMMD